MPRNHRIPSYRLHKATGQAVVVLSGQSIYLGRWNTPDSRGKYEQVIAEWLASRKQLSLAAGKNSQVADHQNSLLTVSELMLAYWQHAEGYYQADGETTSEVRCIREALRPLRELYGSTEAAKFGPLALKAVRQKMIAKGWCRTHINHQINRVRRVFRWGVSEELIPPFVHDALRSVAGLSKGRCGVRESTPVEPAIWDDVKAILPHCSRPIAAMLQLQWLTGMRSCEVRIMRMQDLDRSHSDRWLYRPGSDQGPSGRHKNAWRGQERVIVLGPQAIGLLTPWLREQEPQAYLFQPKIAVEERNARRRAERQTRRPPSQLARKRKAAPKRAPGLYYRSSSYAHAVAVACEKAGIKFQPYGLRHGRKMVIERSAGADAARAVLGQKSIQATQHYGRLDLIKASEVMQTLG